MSINGVFSDIQADSVPIIGVFYVAGILTLTGSLPPPVTLDIFDSEKKVISTNTLRLNTELPTNTSTAFKKLNLLARVSATFNEIGIYGVRVILNDKTIFEDTNFFRLIQK